MAKLGPSKLPDDLKVKCCDCDEVITAETIRDGSYPYIVSSAGGSDARTQPPPDYGLVLRCECCHEDYLEKHCTCDDD